MNALKTYHWGCFEQNFVRVRYSVLECIFCDTIVSYTNRTEVVFTIHKPSVYRMAPWRTLRL